MNTNLPEDETADSQVEGILFADIKTAIEKEMPHANGNTLLFEDLKIKFEQEIEEYVSLNILQDSERNTLYDLLNAYAPEATA